MFLTSRHSSDTETMPSRCEDNKPSMNCSDIGVSPVRTARNDMECRQLPCTSNNTGSVSPLSSCNHDDSMLCLSLNESELNNESGFDVANSSSLDDIGSVVGPETCSGDLRRNVATHRVTDCRVNMDVAVSERNTVNTVQIDRNCNELVPTDCKHDWNIFNDEYERDSFHKQSSDEQTSPSVSLHACIDDGMLQSDTSSLDTNIAVNSVHATSVVLTV